MKKIWKKTVSVGLALAMALGLAGCGKGGDNQENAGLAKEHVYKVQEFELPDPGGDDYGIRGSSYQDGMLYLIMEVYHWSGEKGDSLDMRMVSMKEDGTDANMISLEIPQWRTRPVNNGEEDNQDTPVEDLNAANDVARMENEDTAGLEDTAGSEEGAESGESAESEEGTEGEDGLEEGASDVAAAVDTSSDVMLGNENDYYEYSGYGDFQFGGDGKLYSMRNYYFEDYASEEYSSVQKNYISCWNMDGSLAWEKEVEGLTTEEESVYVAGMSVGQDGSITLILSGENVYKMAVDAQGNVSERVTLPEDAAKIFSNYSTMMKKDDGTFVVMYNDEGDSQKQFIVSYDPATDKVGQPSPLPSSIAWNGYNTMSVGKNSDLIYSNDKGVFTYTAGQEEAVEKMNFINSDLNISNFTSLTELSDTSFLGIFTENYDEQRAGIFTYVDPKDIPDKAVLVMAGNYVGSDVKQRIVEYNRSSEEYRITLKEYDSYNTYDDYEAGMTQLNNDITSGNMPDILVTDGLPAENYVAKGLLADVGKLIEEDETLSQVEFVQNVLDAYKVDGKLCYVIPYFNVSTVIGKKSIVGDRNSWTMADMKELMESLPEGTQMFGEMTRDSFLYSAMDYCGGDFVDVSSGKCAFDSQDFIDMLEYANTLPEELNQEDYNEDYWANYESQYREDRTILRNLYIGSLSNVNYAVYGNFGEEVSYIGFPTESGMGAYVQAGVSYAISARSKNIDGAWDFLRYYLTDEFQETLEWGLPIQKSYFLEASKKATQRPYYLDENGEKVEYDDTYYINGEEIVLDPMTQEQVDRVVNYIFSIDKSYYNNTDITNIISEEAASFFAGQKSAQEVANVIQSRAQIYVDEKR